MDVYVKAKELAKLIEESDELCKLKELEAKAMHDDVAKEIMMDYSDVYDDMQDALTEDDEERIEELTKEYDEIKKRIGEYELTKMMFEAKDRFDKMIESVSDIISHAIGGEKEESCCGGNSDKSCNCGDSCDGGSCT